MPVATTKTVPNAVVNPCTYIPRKAGESWLIVSGGKFDFTAKWWDPRRLQQVVDHFRGRIIFVQVGEAGHHHPPLRNVIDLRGKTDLRQLVRLVYHSQGVLTAVNALMHLAAAVEVKGGKPQNRPCVVVAGGREPLTPSMGSEWWYPLWEKLVKLDVPCTVHASASLNPAMHLTNAYYIAHHNSAAVEILKSRVFKDFPKLKIIIPHGGGAIPYQWNRQRGMHVKEGLEPFEEAARRVYWDMAIYDKESMELLIQRVGADRVLFATEMFGAVNAIDPKTGKNFEDLVPIFKSIDWLTDEERYKITEGNAKKVFSRMSASTKV